MKIFEKMQQVVSLFEEKQIEEAWVDARELISFGIGCSPIFIKMNPQLDIDFETEKKIDEFVQRRLAFEPVSKIKGSRGFWNLDFKVTKDVLDPRPDSEINIESVLKYKKDKLEALKILDIGTGSGCLALSLLGEYVYAEAAGIDKSIEALKIAEENAKINKLSDRFKVLCVDWNNPDWVSHLQPKYDVIISNPPYIKNDEILQKEVVLYDPAIALFGGKDGLDPYRIISKSLSNLLNKKGLAVFEFGQGQELEVRKILEKSDLQFIDYGIDLGGIVRCIILQKK